MRIGGRIVLIAAFILTLAGGLPAAEASAALRAEALQVEAMPAEAPLAQSAQLITVSPANCPYGGCAAGQRLNMRFEFEPSAYEGSQNPNVKICVYAPSSWAVPANSVTVESEGQVTRQPYSPPAAEDPGCSQDSAQPADYDLMLARVAQLDANTFGDALGFGFRLGAGASGSGRVLARIFARAADGSWSRVQQATSNPTLTIAAAVSPAYAANDAAICGTASPCYVNSGEDLPGGLGTGLKDAVDAVPADGRVIVLGSYTIKSSTVVINRALTLTGLNDSRITFSGTGACDAPMLSLEDAVKLRELNINDGACSNPSRSLIQVNSREPVEIENNDLSGGSDAIVILNHPEADSSDLIRIRGNAITGNQGYAVRAQVASSNVPLEITANNLHSNRSGAAVECGEGAPAVLPFRKANHNYWGASAPAAADTRCTIDAAQRLGMPIVLEPFLPGVRARRVTVTESKTYLEAFERQIAYQRSGGADFDLYVVDHGYATAGGPPFTYAQGGASPSPCSNYWDVFLPDGVTPAGTLELFLKYDRTAGCQATINSNQYCEQTGKPWLYPLYWYDPRGGSAARWITTGSEIQTGTSGQTTACNITLNEIQVSIDNSGRPSLERDFFYTPLMVGVPVLKSFSLFADSKIVRVDWVTNNEPDVVGFYLWRGPDLNHMSPITELIGHSGTALVGRSYTYRDEGRVNGVTYVYRLQVLRSDGTSIYSQALSIVPNQATITPTPTRAPTWTPWPSSTPFPTAVPSQQPTRVPSATRPIVGITPSATGLVLSTLTPTLDYRTPGAQFTATARIRTQQAFFATASVEALAREGTPGSGLTGTPIAMLPSETPDFTVTPTETALPDTPTPTPSGTPSAIAGRSTGSDSNPWLSLLMGLLAGGATAGLVGGLWYFLRLRPGAPSGM